VSPLEAVKALIVEDEFLIATDLESMLRKLGASEVRIELSIDSALAGLRERLPDCAVLDIGLREETPEKIADLLLEQHVPFIFVTGYDDALPLPTRLRTMPLVRKPVNAVDLEEALVRAFALARG
jgi:two-component SAPR family response regulator